MKKLVLTVLTALATSASFAQQGFNGGFEDWDSVNVGFFKNHQAQGWTDIYNGLCSSEGKPFSVVRTTDARTGNYAVSIKNIAISVNRSSMFMTSSGESGLTNNRIPVSTRYTKLEGWYKYNTPSKDTFTVNVFMLKGDDFIGMAEYHQSATASNYTKFSIPIVYMSAATVIPDSAVIIIYSGSTENFVEGSELILDDLALTTGSTGLNDADNDWITKAEIWPNPASDYLNVEVKGKLTGTITVELVNVLGQTLKQTEVKGSRNEISTSFDLKDVPKGVLFVKISNGQSSRGFRVLNQ